MDILKKRIMTALVLIPLTLFVLFYASPPVFCVITGLISLGGAWEWSNFTEIKKTSHRVFYLLTVVLIFSAALFFPIPWMLIGAFIFWVLATVLIVLYPRASEYWSKGMVVRGTMGVFVILPSWAALNYIRDENQGVYVLLFLFLLIWGADSAAYFVGKKWGRDKLAPSVSPGKSRQGFYGALVFSILITLLMLWFCHLDFDIWPWALALSLITVIFSVIGDLFESMMKRQVGLKDSGNLLPGHGGLLDRIDSLTAAAPVFA